MATATPQTDATFQTCGVTASVVTDTNSVTSNAIDASSSIEVEVYVKVVYGTGVDEGAKIYLLAETDSDEYQDANDDPAFVIEMPVSASATRRHSFKVKNLANFKVLVSNNTGQSITVTVKYKRRTGVDIT